MVKHQPPSKKRTSKAVNEEINGSDDEEIDEDEAFNSDDERKYGSFFEAQSKGRKSNKDNEDDDDEDGNEDDYSEESSDSESDESDAEEDDGGQYMLDLLKNIDNENNKSDKGKTSTSLLAPHIPESQFASSVIPNAQLTLDSLMEGLKDTKGFGTIQKTMKHVAQGQATSAP